MGSEIVVTGFFVPNTTIAEATDKCQKSIEAEKDIREQMFALVMSDPRENVVFKDKDTEPKFASEATRKRLRELDGELRKVIADGYLPARIVSYLEDKDIWEAEHGSLREENGGVVIPMFYSCESFDPSNTDAARCCTDRTLKNLFSVLLKTAVAKTKPEPGELDDLLDEYISELYSLNFINVVGEAHCKDPKSVEWSW